ncbi:hypothetical protein [Nevskia ramosa]|uniref:hypothetical protein n=1 Tax=Nevskia ramosa TaxID=64002 RepID=UPI001B7FB635|nr:hypothetical protein [Nevskia ramosa]
MQEVLEQGKQAGTGHELIAGDLNIAIQLDDRPLQLAVPPEAESIAIAIHQVRQAGQLLPLSLVMRILEPTWVGTLARCLQFNETDQRAVDRHRVVRPGLQIGNRGFADRRQLVRRNGAKPAQVAQQLFERRTKLVFGLAVGDRVVQLLSSDTAISGNRKFQRQLLSRHRLIPWRGRISAVRRPCYSLF